jgi:hypothetical protein
MMLSAQVLLLLSAVSLVRAEDLSASALDQMHRKLEDRASEDATERDAYGT